MPGSCSFKFQPITCEHIRSLLLSLNSTKRGGSSQTPTFVYQIIADLIVLPITLLINETLKSSIFPDCLKSALVTPIFKKGDPTDPANYRPISSLPILSKIFEKVLKQQIMNFIEKHNKLSSRQFGYRKHHSTEQLILALLQKLAERSRQCQTLLYSCNFTRHQKSLWFNRP